MLRTVLFLSLVIVTPLRAQESLLSQLTPGHVVPKGLLASRSVVLYSHAYNQSELEEAQRMFAQIGIDAEAYLEEDVITAGKEVAQAYARYFSSRGIKFLVMLSKVNGRYQIMVTPFNDKPGLVDPGQAAWAENDVQLAELLKNVLRNSWIRQKKENLLINETPEKDVEVKFINGRRSEFFAIDLKVDLLAVPLFDNAEADTALMRIMKEVYPFKNKVASSAWTDEELIRKGYNYVLCFLHTRGVAAKQLLGYDMTKSESAYASITFQDKQQVLKAIPAETPIYKFYVRHLRSGNVFFGTRWDADTTWDQALRNHLLGFKAELRID